MLISLSEFRTLVDNTRPRLMRDADPSDAKLFVGIQDEPHYQQD